MIATNFNVREFPTVQSVMQSLDERFPADKREFASQKGLELLRLLLFVLGSCLQIAGKTADLLGSWMLEASKRPIAPVEAVASVETVDASPLEASEVAVESAQVFAATEERPEAEMLNDIQQSEVEEDVTDPAIADEIQSSQADTSTQPIDQPLPPHVIPSSKNKHPNRHAGR